MKKIILILLSILSINIFACHTTSLTLVSSPTPIGGGKYSTTINVCFGEYTAGNWGGTKNFKFTVSGTTFVSFLPATITNNYKAFTTASCSGPNCFMGTCASISSTATGNLTSSTIITYNTTSSIPAGYPIVPDDNESCTGCPTSFCFNFTFITNGYPTSISLGGNIEVTTPYICQVICGHSSTYAGGPCNGLFDADMTISFSILPIELVSFDGYRDNYYNLINWVTVTESNNDYFTLEKSSDAVNWSTVYIKNGAGNSLTPILYEFKDYSISNDISYYRLMQTDFNGQIEIFSIIAVVDTKDNRPKGRIIKKTNLLGQECDCNNCIIIYYYTDGSHEKIYKP